MVPVLFLCATIFSVPAFFGLLPLMVNFGELFNYRIKVLAAGLLTGSALALIIPEGVGGLFEAGDTKGWITAEMLAGSALLAGCFTMIIVQYGLEEFLQHKDSPVVRGGEARVNDELTSGHGMLAGLLVHSIAEGVAIAFMAAFEQQKVSYTISLATALHKMPATLGLVTHLVGVGWQKFYVIGGLLAFAMASPAAILLTYKLLEQAPNLLGAVSVSLFVTFSGGVFLYVALANLVGINSLKSTLGARQQLLLLFCGLSLPILFEFMLGRLS